MRDTPYYTDLGAFSADFPEYACAHRIPPTSLPFRIPKSLASRFPENGNPVLGQFIPSGHESKILPCESGDPLGERGHEVLPFLVHQYPSRVLIRTTDQCAAYCRFCFRRNLQTNGRGYLTKSHIDSICAYLQSHQPIREILVSGGDPLFASDSKIIELIGSLRKVAPDSVIRLCTRMPIIMPERISEHFLQQLQQFNPVVFVIHTNHELELDQETRKAFRQISLHGFRMFSQTVLLKGLNDDTKTLSSLFASLFTLGVNPYYLFQGDLAAGTAHFRVPLSRGLSIYRELRRTLSGMELPRYAVDAPNGCGKVYLPEEAERISERDWRLYLPDGSTSNYPEE